MPSWLSLAMCLTASEALAGGSWHTCGGLTPALNRTACPTDTATCCVQKWMPVEGNWGCCALPNAVCCQNGYTCCPAGTTCSDEGSGWNTKTTCIPMPRTQTGGNLTGEQVCKFADPGTERGVGWRGKKSVVVIGDSVSIGYTAELMKQLADVADVTHSPYPNDGGAEETKYGARCIDYLLRFPNGTPIKPDVIMFNWGLHNALLGNKSGTRYVDGQSAPPSEYAPYLKPIMQRVRTAAPKVLFALTTPDLCDAGIDDIVSTLNQQAMSIARTLNIETLDLHAPLIKQCGAAPTRTCCFGPPNGCFCPHSNSDGYAWLVQAAIAPAIRKLLNDDVGTVV